jgi:hypothetical protein
MTNSREKNEDQKNFAFFTVFAAVTALLATTAFAFSDI